MNHTTEPQASDGARHVPVERLQHYIPEVEQRVQGWFASGQPLVWIPILSQENFPDVPQQLLEFVLDGLHAVTKRQPQARGAVKHHDSHPIVVAESPQGLVGRGCDPLHVRTHTGADVE